MIPKLLTLSAAVLLHGGPSMVRAGTPCQAVASISSAYLAQYTSESVALVDAQVAKDCLMSVPVNKEEDLALIEEMQMFIHWQSNIAFLNDPPEGYNERRIDIEDAINYIKKHLKEDRYDDEYTLMTDITRALDRSGDFHFEFNSDIASVFQFRRGNVGLGLKDEFALISISSDGQELPELYNYYDIMEGDSEDWKPSPIVEIQNQTANTFLRRWSEAFVYHEDHARYNNLFPNQPSIALGGVGSPFGRINYPDGDYTWIKHKNGTTHRYVNVARIMKTGDAFNGIETGEDFFNAFCNRGPPNTNTKREVMEHHKKRYELPSRSKRQEEVAEPTATGYPQPQMLHSEVMVSGYYLEGEDYDDVAVLSVPTFSPDTTEGGEEFQDLVGEFLHTAKSEGKKKLIIDLRGNTGGQVFMGFDLFKQLFPKQDPESTVRFRANEAFELTGRKYTEDFLSEVTYEDAIEAWEGDGTNSAIGSTYRSIFNYQIPLKPDGSNFSSFEEFFGPHEFNGDNYTSVALVDLNNYFSDDLSMDVTGYRTRADKLYKDQPFESKNIVMLQDGSCGSTCAVFAEFMKTQGKVQQVVVGGLPEVGPMQGVGGSKGSQVFTWSRVYAEANEAYEALTDDDKKEVDETELGKLIAAERPLNRSAYTASGEIRSRINLKDNMRKGDKSGIPLEFIYEAADCRLFYTKEMVRNVTNVWKKTVDAQWGGVANELCVEGSRGHKSSLSGSDTTDGNGGSNENTTSEMNQEKKPEQKQEGAAGKMTISGSLMALAAFSASMFVLM